MSALTGHFGIEIAVTSFRATLEEVERAEIVLHVQDAANPMREEQNAHVEKVLAELAVSTEPVIQVLNKIDLVPLRELPHLSSDRRFLASAHRTRTTPDCPNADLTFAY